MEEQRLPGLGAHDVELMSAPDGERLLAVANQGDGADCATGSLDVYARRSGRWALVQRLRAGCATYASSFVLAGRLHVALAVERTGADESDQQSYRAESPVYVYKGKRLGIWTVDSNFKRIPETVLEDYDLVVA